MSGCSNPAGHSPGRDPEFVIAKRESKRRMFARRHTGDGDSDGFTGVREPNRPSPPSRSDAIELPVPDGSS
jgi:hypothetical protein